MTEDDVSYAALLEEALEEAIAIKEGRVDPSRTHEALMIPFEIDVEGGFGNTEVRFEIGGRTFVEESKADRLSVEPEAATT